MAPRKPASKSKVRRIPARTRNAFHEAGHAVLSAAIGDFPRHVSIRRVGRSQGRSTQMMFAHDEYLVQIDLAGYAAEDILANERPREFETQLGFAILCATVPALAESEAAEELVGRDETHAVERVLRMGCPEVDTDLRREVERFYAAARATLMELWPSVSALADALLKHEELDRDQLDVLIGGADLCTTAFAVQAAHGLDRMELRARRMPALSAG